MRYLSNKQSPYIMDWLDTATCTRIINFNITYAHNWDVSRAITFRYLRGKIAGVAQWDTGSVRWVRDAFSLAVGDIKHLSNWNTANIVNMRCIFGPYIYGNFASLATWNTGKVNNMICLFKKSAITGDIAELASWQTNRLIYAQNMFYRSKIKGDVAALASWDLHNLIDASYMFSHSEISGDISALSDWSTPRLRNARGMFKYSKIKGDIRHLSKWGIERLHLYDSVDFMFQNSLLTGDLSTLNWDNRWQYADLMIAGSAITDVENCIRKWRERN